MSIEISLITELSELQELDSKWRELAAHGRGGGLFRGPDWQIPWWHAYHQVLHAQLHVLAGWMDDKLVCLAPFYQRVGRGVPGIKVREIRLLGDAGPRPTALDVLAAPGFEDRAGTALAKYLAERDDEWDVIDLEPLREPSATRASLISWLAHSDHQVESAKAGGSVRRIALAVAGIGLEPESASESETMARAYTDDPAALRKGLSALKRLSRLEWAVSEEASPFADPEAAQLLEEVTLELGREGRARLARLDDSSGEAIAAMLVMDDGDRAVVVAGAVDPQHMELHAGARLLLAEARHALTRGRVALDVVTGAHEYELPPLPTTRADALRVRVFSRSGAATVARTFDAVRKRVEAAREAPGTAAAGARAAWAKIRTAAANVAHYERLHLYRGELYVKGIEPTRGLTLSTFTEEEFSAMPDQQRAEMIEVLHLNEAYCRQKWQRGDIVILARLLDRPAGIAWCARTPVEIPELGRTLNLANTEAYIHDVYVAPQARGRSVAPSMLEFLAMELRERDVYRSWALISPENIASVRAFEKAAYAAVADVVYAHLGAMDRLIVRPPDPEAKKLLGIT